MDIAYKIAQLVVDFGSGLFSLGGNTFVGTMPDNITTGVLVEHIGGSLNNYLPIEESIVNVYFISTQDTTVTLAEAFKRSVHRLHNTEPDTDVYIYSILAGDVEDMGRDAESQQTYKVTLTVTHRATGVIS